MLRSAFLVILLSTFVGAAEAKPTKSCKARVALLEKRLDAIPTHVGFGVSPIQVEPPTVEAGEPVMTRGIIVDIKGEALGIEGVLIEDGLKTYDEQRSRMKEIEGMIGDVGAPAYVRVDHRTKISTALPFLCSMAEERPVHLVVRHARLEGKGYQPPPPSETARKLIGDIMQQKDPSARAALMANSFSATIRSCDALVSGMDAVRFAPATSRTHFMKRIVVDGVRACGCEAQDVETLESLLILMSAPVSPVTHALSKPLPCGQAKPHGLSQEETFGKLVAELAE